MLSDSLTPTSPSGQASARVVPQPRPGKAPSPPTLPGGQAFLAALTSAVDLDYLFVKIFFFFTFIKNLDREEYPLSLTYSIALLSSSFLAALEVGHY